MASHIGEGNRFSNVTNSSPFLLPSLDDGKKPVLTIFERRNFSIFRSSQVRVQKALHELKLFIFFFHEKITKVLRIILFRPTVELIECSSQSDFILFICSTIAHVRCARCGAVKRYTFFVIAFSIGFSNRKATPILTTRPTAIKKIIRRDVSLYAVYV